LIWTFVTLFSLSTATVSEPSEKGTNAIRELMAEDEKGDADPKNLDIEV